MQLQAFLCSLSLYSLLSFSLYVLNSYECKSRCMRDENQDIISSDNGAKNASGTQ